MLVFEDQHSHIIPITANEGKTQLGGGKEDHVCDWRYHAMYGLSKRADNSLLKQLSKLATFAKFEMQQVSTI